MLSGQYKQNRVKTYARYFLFAQAKSGGAPGAANRGSHPPEAAHHTTNFDFSFFRTGTLFNVT